MFQYILNSIVYLEKLHATYGTSSFSNSTGSACAWMASIAVEYAAIRCRTDRPLDKAAQAKTHVIKYLIKQ